ncbi:katanin p80 WD40 repeat-containing subunit B1 isoform X2 [Nilaparvata lugens]|uniref:katanin p80 WD40 repeat-containing subunit B1 isoform X2 n=1 Tax=Nilaparvata lugens TaxID=108931 RepID=UPI00193EBE4E|nr:katanin p80 WD40 repeat-containing subunit B1 isoform X2 [Nilaparvata lugens]
MQHFLGFYNQYNDRKFTTVRYDCTGKNIVTGAVNGVITVYETKTLEKLHVLTTPPVDNDEFIPVSAVAPFPVRRASYGQWCIASYSNGFLKLWNIEEEKCLVTLNEARQSLGVRIHSYFPIFASYGGDSNIFIYNEETMSVRQTHTLSAFAPKKDGHVGSINTLVFHPQNANEFLTAGWDNSVHYWDLRRANSARSITGLNITGDGLDISPNGKEILTCIFQDKNSLQKWDYATGKFLQTYEADLFNSKLNCGKWFDPNYIATGGCDPAIFRIVNVPRKRTVGYYRSQQSGITSLDTFVDVEEPREETHEDEIGHTFKKGYTGSTRLEVPAEEEGRTMYKMVYCMNRHLVEANAVLPLS